MVGQGREEGVIAAGLWKALLAFAAAAAEGRLWSVSDCRKNSIWFYVQTDTKTQCKKMNRGEEEIDSFCNFHLVLRILFICAIVFSGVIDMLHGIIYVIYICNIF